MSETNKQKKNKKRTEKSKYIMIYAQLKQTITLERLWKPISSVAHFNSSLYILFFHQLVIVFFYCMHRLLVKTVAYSSA